MRRYDDDLDPDGPSRDDIERFGDPYVTCPECGSLVYDESDVCQSCGRALHGEPKGVPLWAIAVGAALAAVLIAGAVIWW